MTEEIGYSRFLLLCFVLCWGYGGLLLHLNLRLVPRACCFIWRIY
ncbi:hypothetical protein MIZ03_1322 [Rhodoferax lithotrophicus]|uniref:Uncharacterized protein n=1 Tax=Rhodoferax lithotrophicus TaxID=2798804 RepID=A0ABM7MJU5_9BURK|nr:hypothetical protein MIZ03_1322 [Rhodoferax sp. MIZ03]